MKNIYKIAMALMIICGTSCSSVRIANSRNVTDVVPGSMRRIMVVAMAESGDSVRRRDIETRCSRDLRFLGYESSPSYPSYVMEDFNPANETLIMQRIAGDSIDAIMTIALVNWEVDKKQMPDDLWCSPYNNYNRLFWCYQTEVLKKSSKKAYYDERARFIWEVNLFDAKDQHLIYCARTNPRKKHKAIKDAADYCDLVLADMVWECVLEIRQ